MSVAYAHSDPESFRGPWTAEDVLAFPDNDIQYEVVDGALIMNPPPAPRHQRASYRLHHLLDDMAAGVDILEAVGLRLPRGQLLIPDLVVARAAGDGPLLDPAEVMLVVELVSPGSTTRDRHEKPYLYAEAGIPFFWLIELGTYKGRVDPLPVVFAHVLGEDGDYEVTHRVGAGTVFAVDEPFAVKFDPAQLADG